MLNPICKTKIGDKFVDRYGIVVWGSTTLGNLTRALMACPYTPKESHPHSGKLTDQRLVYQASVPLRSRDSLTYISNPMSWLKTTTNFITTTPDTPYTNPSLNITSCLKRRNQHPSKATERPSRTAEKDLTTTVWMSA